MAPIVNVMSVITCTVLLEIPTFSPAIKLTYGWNRFGKRAMKNLKIRIYF